MATYASHSEIIRSNQKDLYYAGAIKTKLADVVQSVFGPRHWMKWHREIELLSDLCYFCLTTVAGYQTLGEEYVGVIQVNRTKSSVPTFIKRCLYTFLHVTFPYCFDKVLLYGEQKLQRDVDLRITNVQRGRLIQCISVLQNILTITHRLHLAIFYWRGYFYHIAKRILGIYYARVRQSQNDIGTFSTYKLLAFFGFVQLMYSLISTVVKLSKQALISNSSQIENTRNIKNNSSGTDILMSHKKCPLCLETINCASLTPCGHVFCWHCIHEWCSSKAICPLCRDKFNLSRIVMLKNYS